MKFETKIKKYENVGLNEDQLYIVRLGFSCGFTQKQVALYAKPEFSHIQMKIIWRGISHSLTNKQLELLANPLFSSEQMSIIEDAFHTHKFSTKEVMSFANPQHLPEEMETFVKKIKLQKAEKMRQDIMRIYYE